MRKSTVGQMVNLLSNDVNRFDLCVIFLHYIWAGPLQLIIVIALTWLKIGPSTLAGAALVIAFVPIQSKNDPPGHRQCPLFVLFHNDARH